MNPERFEKIKNFALELDKEKNILRQTHILDYKRQENDAEHAWHMALMIYLFKEYANEEFDVLKAIMMALVHDVVEIDAGDTYAYSEGDKKTQKEREEKAAERIFGILPEDLGDEMRSLFEEYEKGESAEAKFVRVMDNFQPLLLNDANNGKDWKRFNIKKSQVMERQGKSEPGSKDIWEYSKRIIEDNTRKGNLIDE